MSVSKTDHSTFIKKINENKSQEEWRKLLKEKQEEINKLEKQVEKLERKLKDEIETSLMMYHSP